MRAERRPPGYGRAEVSARVARGGPRLAALHVFAPFFAALAPVVPTFVPIFPAIFAAVRAPFLATILAPLFPAVGAVACGPLGWRTHARAAAGGRVGARAHRLGRAGPRLSGA